MNKHEWSTYIWNLLGVALAGGWFIVVTVVTLVRYT
jgi:hypothetical protein